MLPRLDVSGLVGKRVPVGRAIIVTHEFGRGWRAQEYLRYRDGWDAVAEARPISLADVPRGVWVTFCSPPVPLASVASTRERIIASSLRNASGKAAMPPHREEVLI